MLALFDCGLDDALRQEGAAREIISRVQQLRKKAALSVEDSVEIFYETKDAGLEAVCAPYSPYSKALLGSASAHRRCTPGYQLRI